MIKITGNGYFASYEEAETGMKVPEEGLYLFLVSKAKGAGTTSNEAILSKDQENYQGGGRFPLPAFTAEELAGGQGANSYCQMIDKLEDLAVNHLSAFNEHLTFTKISIAQ